MRRIFLLFILMALGSQVTADDLVTRQVLHEKPVTGSDGMVVIVSTLTLSPGGRIPLHTHPGDEHAVIVVGGDALMPSGKEMVFPSGTALFFPAGSVHGGVTNRGESDIKIVTTHIVEAGRPFSTPAE